MRCSLRLLLLAVASVTPAAASATTVPFFVPFTEDFTSTAQNWRTSSSAPAGTATYNATGGPTGDSYISSTFTTPVTGTASSSQVVFRARDQYETSSNIFFGDWISAGVPSIDFWFRQDSGQAINVGLRLSALDNPGQAMLARFPTAVPSGVWTHLTMAINPTNPELLDETGPTHANYNDIFSHVNYMTLFTDLSNPAIGNSTLITFGLDKFNVVPEPSTWLIAVLGVPALGLGLLARRRRLAV